MPLMTCISDVNAGPSTEIYFSPKVGKREWKPCPRADNTQNFCFLARVPCFCLMILEMDMVNKFGREFKDLGNRRSSTTRDGAWSCYIFNKDFARMTKSVEQHVQGGAFMSLPQSIHIRLLSNLRYKEILKGAALG